MTWFRREAASRKSLELKKFPKAFRYGFLVQYAQYFLHVAGNTVRIRFKKKGVQGINIYYRKKGSSEWIFLTHATHSPYEHHLTLEKPGQPLHLEYIAYGVVKDKEIGLPSEIAQVVYGG